MSLLMQKSSTCAQPRQRTQQKLAWPNLPLASAIFHCFYGHMQSLHTAARSRKQHAWSRRQSPTVPDSLSVRVPTETTPVPEGPAPWPSSARPPAATRRT